MNTKIVIRCITDESKGYGNFKRCLIFAEGIRKKGLSVSFIINFNTVCISELERKKFDYILIPRLDHKMESDVIKRIAHEKNSRLVVIDMREFTESLSKIMKDNQFKTIIFDDAWCRKVYADYVFNGTIVKEYHNYEKINKNAKFFLGPKYFITSPEFCLHKKMICEIRDKKIYSVVISLGGSDLYQLTLFILKSISRLTNIKITVITGPFYKNSVKLKKFVEKKHNVTIIHSPSNIWKNFRRADVVISNAGSTLYELAIQRIPTMYVPIVKHQILYAKQFELLGFGINLGLWKNLDEEKIKKILSVLLKNKNKRKKMWVAARNIVDGQGLTRTVDVIGRLLK